MIIITKKQNKLPIFVDTIYGAAMELIHMRWVVSHARTDRVQTIYQTITVELSTMDFDGLMAFIGAEEAIAA